MCLFPESFVEMCLQGVNGTNPRVHLWLEAIVILITMHALYASCALGMSVASL